MNDDSAAVSAAEEIVRDAAEGVEQVIESLDLQMRLAAAQLQQASDAADEALSRLYAAAAAYGPLQAQASRQVAALGLSAEAYPNEDAILPQTGIDGDGLLVLKGRAYAPHSPADILLRGVIFALNEHAALPAGARIELRVQGYPGGGE